MGSSCPKKEFKKEIEYVFRDSNEEKEKIEHNFIQNNFQKFKEERKDPEIYKLNIFIYYNNNIDRDLIDILSNYNDYMFNWGKKAIQGFSKKNSSIIIEQFEKDFDNKNFKNVIIFPINSFSEFENDLKSDGKNVLADFNEHLIDEQQPFFLLIDSKENDFIKTYETEVTIDKYLELKRKEIDFEIFSEINLLKEQTHKIEKFKKCILNKKKSSDDFTIIINGQKYETKFGKENKKLETFLSIFEDEEIDLFNISFLSINQNGKYSEEIEIYHNYKQNISDLKFICYEFKKEKIKNLLDNYNRLDARNFNVLRMSKSINMQLIKYTGYYNQFGDILYCDQSSSYAAKINIAIGGYSGSGKSTLINTIFGEKRCLEGQGCSITNYIS